MYSLVLATLLTTGSAAPATGFGWHSSCYSCCGCYSSCSCYGCYGCYGCCGGCYGCHGCWGGCYSHYSCCGCCGGCYGCWGSCHGCYSANVVYYYPVYSTCCSCCGGCYGTVVPVPSTAPKAKEKLPAPQKEASAANFATVVIAAASDVRITINGQPLAMKASEQAFITPELEPESNYSYVVKAEAIRDGQMVTKSQKVMVKAGREVRVDFSSLAAGATAANSVANGD